MKTEKSECFQVEIINCTNTGCKMSAEHQPHETGSGGYKGSQTELESTLSHDCKKNIMVGCVNRRVAHKSHMK